MSIPKTCCANCKIGLTRKDCTEDDFNLCMAQMYMEKALKGYSLNTVIDEVLCPFLTIERRKEIIQIMLNGLN